MRYEASFASFDLTVNYRLETVPNASVNLPLLDLTMAPHQLSVRGSPLVS